MKTKILVVGQTPPPYGGQAMIIKKIIDAKYDNAIVYSIRMSFSKEMASMGKLELAKIFHLFEVIIKIFYYRLRYNIKVLYYPPSGPIKNAIFRDVLILISTRWLFSKVIFQYFAGGISEYYKTASKYEKVIMRCAYSKADLSLRPSKYSPNDGKEFNCKKEMIFPWGVEDNYHEYSNKKLNDIINILFVGVLKESKGILVLLRACNILRKKKLKFNVKVLGAYNSKEIESEIKTYCSNNELDDIISFEGVKTGDEYFNYYRNADIFCFPSFFESENLPVVLIDSTKFALPVVTTNWRSISEVIENNRNGFLTNIKNEYEVADKLELLIKDIELRTRMGKESRKIFENKFDIRLFTIKMNEVFQYI